MIFDPSAGNGSFFIAAHTLSELAFLMADLAALEGDDDMADAFWQAGALASTMTTNTLN